MAPEWRYLGGVPSVQIKNVPDEVHRVLRRRADAAGQSLQEYLLALLTRETEQLTVTEWADRMMNRPPFETNVTRESIVEAIREHRGPLGPPPTGDRAKRMSSAELIREDRGPLPKPSAQ